MDLCIRIPVSPGDDIVPYLEAIRVDKWDGIELPGAVMQDDSGWEDALEAFGVHCIGLADLLPDAATRYLPETADAARDRLTAYMKTIMSRAAILDLQYAVIDTGLDRVAAPELDAEITARSTLLRTLMALADTHEITACVPANLPAPPYRRDLLQRAARLVREVNHPRCQLALDIRPDEMPDRPAPTDILREHAHNLAVIRFHYEPELGLGFEPDLQALWADALRASHYRGAVVFCPQLRGADAIRQQSRDLQDSLQETWRGLTLGPTDDNPFG